MQSDQNIRSAHNQTRRPENSLIRQDSFLQRMNIYTNGIYTRGSSQQNQEVVPNVQEQSVFVPRQETHWNVFTGFDKKPVGRAVPQTKPNTNFTQNYERQCLQYQKYFFDSRIKMIIKRMAIKAYNVFKNEKQGQFFIFPVQRILVTIAKKLLLNRFELFFLQYTFEMTKWSYDSECIRKQASYFKSYLMLSDSEIGSSDIKLIEIYILYCAFFAKKSLNESSSDMFNNFCLQLCPRFKDCYSDWSSSSGMASKINPKLLNTIFKRLTFNFEKDHEDFENYCLVVQEIIDISPAYNADKSGKQKKPRKGKKQIKQKGEQSVQVSQKQEYNGINDIHDMHGGIIQHEESFDIEPPRFTNKKSSVLSVDLLEPGHYITRSVSQHERK